MGEKKRIHVLRDFCISLYKVDIITCFQCVIILSTLSVCTDILLLIRKFKHICIYICPRISKQLTKERWKGRKALDNIALNQMIIDMSAASYKMTEMIPQLPLT